MNDIEDLYQTASDTLLPFVKDLVQSHLNSENDYLKKYNVSSKIIFTEEKHNHSILLKKYKILKCDCSIYNDNTKFDKYDWIIDGIFGIGLSRNLNENYAKIINLLN